MKPRVIIYKVFFNDSNASVSLRLSGIERLENDVLLVSYTVDKGHNAT